MPYIYLSVYTETVLPDESINDSDISMSWFEDWFDSPLYEKLYAYRNKEEADRLADLIEAEIPKRDYPHVLDLGCGRGRHSISLAERGYHVTGIDLSEEAISKAIKMAAEKDLPNVWFETGDMREPIGSRFDAIVNLFTTFGYFLDDDENSRVIKNISGMLKPGGSLLIDFFNSHTVTKNLVAEESGSFQKLSYKIKRKIEDGMVFKKITFSGPSLPEDIDYLERVKLYDLSWFEHQFISENLTLHKVYGDYSGASFEPQTSPRLIMIGSKKMNTL